MPVEPVASSEQAIDQTQETQPQQPQTAAIKHIRIAYLSANGPVLMPYINGKPSSIQTLDGPTITGWIDVPVGATLSFVGEGSMEPIINDFAIRAGSSAWMTVVVNNSAQAGGLSAFSFNENVEPTAGWLRAGHGL